MPQLEAGRVEKESWKAISVTEKLVDFPFPISRVPQDLVRRACQVPADLMAPARVEDRSQEGQAEKLRDLFKRGASRLRDARVILDRSVHLPGARRGAPGK